MTEDSLTLAWTYYLLGVVGLLLVWWRLLRGLGSGMLRRLLVVMVLALLACPYSVGEDYREMAPALLMLLMELVFDGSTTELHRVGPTLGATVAVVTGLALLVEVLLRRKRAGIAKRGSSAITSDSDSNPDQEPAPS